jgi:hypothetical protein
MAHSLKDVVPVDLQMPMDAALAWSKAGWEREEAERQQRLHEEAEGGTSPTPLRVRAPGQSSGRQPQASPPKDDDNFDDSGDYTTFYRYFGM